MLGILALLAVALAKVGFYFLESTISFSTFGGTTS